MTTHVEKSCAASLALLTDETRKTFLESLSDNAVAAMPYVWEVWANPLHQVEPEGGWLTWVILGGRGAGKTRAGAEWVRARAEGSTATAAGRSQRIALIGETIDQVRQVMVEGESGIIACSPPDRRPKFISSRNKLIWQNGAEATLLSATNYEALRGPQFDAAWCDETGCPAVDLGANTPNLFSDPKSSESALPFGSRGARDDEMQRRFLQAKLGYWSDTGVNPTSSHYGGPMIPPERIFVWTWDARPWPDFPVRQSIWSDGPSHRLGHWITGRVSASALGEVISEICIASGLAASDFDVSQVNGAVDGYILERTQSAREALQPLMQLYGIDAYESGGRLIFATRGTGGTFVIEQTQLVAERDPALGPISRETGRSTEMVDQVRLSYVQSENDYRIGASETRVPSGKSLRISESSLPVSLSGSKAQQIVDRWLSESNRANESIILSLPQSAMVLEPGDVIRLSGDGADERYRIDRITDSISRDVEASRTETALYLPTPAKERDLEPEQSGIPGPLEVVFMDLPIADGSEIDHQPWIAASADPWPGAVSILSSASTSNFRAIHTLFNPATIGRSLSSLPPGAPDRWQRIDWVVLMPSGGVGSSTPLEVLNGDNLLAVEHAGGWEILQFEKAELIDNETYRLSSLLRGQRGTGALASEELEAGARIVVLDLAVEPLPVNRTECGLPRQWRVGPAELDPSDASFETVSFTSGCAGLRPFAPAHLAARLIGETLELRWVRTTRFGGESLEAFEVPFSDLPEQYLLTVRKSGSVLRRIETQTPSHSYSQADRANDGAFGALEISVQQFSGATGYGLERTLKVDV